MTNELEAAELGRVPVGGVPGTTLLIEISGGELRTTFSGTCAAASEGAGQYLGTAEYGGTIDLSGTIEIEVPIIGSESFGPFEVSVPIPTAVEELDLGTLSLQNGEALEGVSPCAAASDSDTDSDDDDDDDDDDDTQGASETGATSSPDDSTSGSSGDAETTEPTTDSTSDNGDESTGMEEGSTTSPPPAGDPVYPDPAGGCPADTVLVELVGTELSYCAPSCDEMQQCPPAESGTATAVCGVLGSGSMDACMFDTDCPADEFCDVDTCLPVEPEFCALDCASGECPDEMVCAEGACVYP